MSGENIWLDWAVKLQSIAQAGLTYGKDKFDIERYEEIRKISAEIIAHKTELPLQKVTELFCNETGYQTPKIDTRAAVFKDTKILLVKENNGTWSLPGGWCDVDCSVKENAEKEVFEEAGIEVSAEKVIAVQDREKHNKPVYAWKICKIFILCSIKKDGKFTANIETTESKYFSLEEISNLNLAEEKNNLEQIKMCFAAYKNKNWQTQLD